MFDLVSYILGRKIGVNNVEISGESNYTFTDTDNDGDIEITEDSNE